MVGAGKEEKTIGEIFGFSPLVRYAALYRDGRLTSRSRAQGEGSSSAESDRYEELLVNPTLLKLAGQRGGHRLRGAGLPFSSATAISFSS